MISCLKYTPAITEWEKIKKLKGSSMELRQWWKEQVKRCMDGYKPSGGTWIPGNYYFYLNFCKIEGLPVGSVRKTMISPTYRDQDHEYFIEVDLAKKGGYGLIVLKARRKGFSMMNASGIMLHEYTFYPNSQNGVGAQRDDYVQDFKKKIMMSWSELPPQLRNKILNNNDDILMSGYKVKEEGTWVEKGMKSMIHFRTMDKPNAFRGTSLNYMIFEEAGEFLHLRKAYQANEECFREGAIQFGTPIIGGTSNQMEIESDDYMEMYTNAPNYNLKSLFIPASKVYGGFFDFTTGTSDVIGATADIMKRREEKKKSGVLDNYYSFLQEMPLIPEDAFVKTGGTPFDLAKINKQIANILTNNNFNIVQKGNLEWAKDNRGKHIFGSKPVWVPDDGGMDVDNGEELFPFEIVEHPLDAFKNIHVGGVDSYFLDDEFEEIKTSKKKTADTKDRSKGCVCIYRRFVNTNVVGELPVAFYTDRPYSKEQFYENCLKLAIYYDSQLLVEYNDDGFLKYFTTHKMTKYLKERPTSADSPWSKATNRYGIHMKSFQKKLLTELIDEYIKAHYEDIYFIKLLNELTEYGIKNTDRVMAFGIALMHDADALKRIIDKAEEDNRQKDFVPHFITDANGNIISVFSEKNNMFDNSSRNVNFDYNL